MPDLGLTVLETPVALPQNDNCIRNHTMNPRNFGSMINPNKRTRKKIIPIPRPKKASLDGFLAGRIAAFTNSDLLFETIKKGNRGQKLILEKNVLKNDPLKI